MKSRNWENKHPKKLKEMWKTFYQKNRKRLIDKMKQYRKENPWTVHLALAKSRCLNQKNNRYSRYGGRGIKINLSAADVKFLWFRDKAFTLQKPSIDRIDNDGDYTLKNCRFIEKIRNVRHGKN